MRPPFCGRSLSLTGEFTMRRILKSIICTLLVLSVLVSVCTVSFADTPETLKVMVATDTHLDNARDFTPLTEDRNYDENNPFFHKTSQGQMDAESEPIIRSMLSEFIDSDEEILLIAGDVTDGYKNNHEVMAQLLSETEAVSGKRIFVVPGNHDIDDDNERKYTSAQEFVNNYYDFGYGEALSRHDGSASYTVDLDDEYRLLAIDSCDYGEDEGEIKGEKLEWIKSQLKTAQLDGKKMVAMMHHSLLTHFYVQFIFDNYMELAELFADSGVKYVFTGHFHGNDIAMAETDNGNRIYDIMTGSLITAPCSYRKVEFSDMGTKISTEYVTKIDAQYLPRGFTELQKSMMESDFQSYAYGFFEEGMKWWLRKTLGRGDNIAGFLGIEEDTKAFEVIDGIMTIVGDALEMPIYNTEETPGEADSIEEIAKMYGRKLPKSEYKYPYQIVASVMNEFFSGDEDINEDSVEIELLFSVVPSGLTYAIGTVLEEYGMTDGMKTFLSKLGISVFDPVKLLNKNLWYLVQKPIDTFLGSALMPIIVGLSDDIYAPGDVNVTLEASETVNVENTVPLTMFEKILGYFRIFFRAVIKFTFPWILK